MAAQRAAPKHSEQAAPGTPAPGPKRVYQAVMLAPEVRHRLRVSAAFLDTELSSLVQTAIVAHLDRLDRHGHRRVRREQLRHRGVLAGVGVVRVDHRARPVEQLAGGGGAGLHVRQLELDALEVVDRLSERDAVLQDWLWKDPGRNVTQVVRHGTPGAQQAALAVKRLRTAGGRSLVEVRPVTGRSHQIRVQLASRGWPILGDGKYGSERRLDGAIALHAASLTFTHPTKGEPVTVTADEPGFWAGLC